MKEVPPHPAFLTPWAPSLIVHVLRFSTDGTEAYSCDQWQAVSGRVCSIRFIGYSSIAAVGSIEGAVTRFLARNCDGWLKGL